jgi:hypothetical protein
MFSTAQAAASGHSGVVLKLLLQTLPVTVERTGVIGHAVRLSFPLAAWVLPDLASPKPTPAVEGICPATDAADNDSAIAPGWLTCGVTAG